MRSREQHKQEIEQALAKVRETPSPFARPHKTKVVPVMKRGHLTRVNVFVYDREDAPKGEGRSEDPS